MTFIKWFETFLEEKNLPFCNWEIADSIGEYNLIDSDVVIEAIRGADPEEQASIKETIVMIDFKNGDVNHFFKHLATGLIEQRLAV